MNILGFFLLPRQQSSITQASHLCLSSAALLSYPVFPYNKQLPTALLPTSKKNLVLGLYVAFFLSFFLAFLS